MAFGGGLDDQEDVVSEINVTPLVDVMLVLLVIFILTVPVLTQSVGVDLPRADKVNTVVNPVAVTVSVNADGTVLWDGVPVDDAKLARVLQNAAQTDPQPEIRLYGDRKAAYEHVVRVMAAAQKAGIEKLGFLTQPRQ